MGETKHLADESALRKIKEIAEGEVAMFCTFADGHTIARPMATQGIDRDGTLWFFSHENSVKNAQIRANDRVQLVYGVPSKSAYLSLVGRARIEKDRATVERLWTPLAKAWFARGKEDPTLTLVAVTPRVGHYWDSERSRMVELAGIVWATLTGQATDDGTQGHLQP